MNRYEHEIISDDTSLRLTFRPVYSVNSYSPLHWHSHLEVIYLLDGSMTASVSEKKYTLRKGELLIISPRELHATRGLGEVSYILLQIPCDYLSKTLEQVSLLHFQTYFPSNMESSAQKELCECLLRLLDLYNRKEDGYRLCFSSVVYYFLYILYRNYSRKVSRELRERENRNLERIEETIQYVRNNYRNEISLSEAAGLLNVSPEYFCRLFKKHTGQTFSEYVNAVRLLHFYQDLVQTDYSITDLMEQNGIHNYKVFMRLFKETYHVTPGRLRKSLSEKPAPNPD